MVSIMTKNNMTIYQYINISTDTLLYILNYCLYKISLTDFNSIALMDALVSEHSGIQISSNLNRLAYND